MQAVIGALRANLGLDSAQFERGAKRSQSAAQKLQKDLRRMATVAAAAGAALVAMAGRGAQEIDRLSKAGRRIGTNVAGMRALELAANEAGVSVGSLADSVQNLDREIAAGSKAAADGLARLGLAASDIEGLEADQKLALIADRVKSMGLSTGEASVLLRDFGIRNRDMVLLLMQGGDALRDARSDIDDYGLALSEVDATAVEVANDQIGRLRLVSDLLAQNLASAVIPAFGRLAEKITDSVREGGLLRSIIDSLVNNIGRLSSIILAFAGLMAGRYVRAFVAARLATASLSGALLFLRGALIRTGIGALIVGAGELIFQFSKLVKAAGGFGNAFSLLKDVVVEVFSRIKMGASAAGAAATAMFFEIKADAASGMASAIESVVGFGNNAVNTFQGTFFAIRDVFGALPDVFARIGALSINKLIEAMEAGLAGITRGVNTLITIGGRFPELALDPPDLSGFNRVVPQAVDIGGLAAEGFARGFETSLLSVPDLGLDAVAIEALRSANFYRQASEDLAAATTAPLASIQALRDTFASADEEGATALEGSAESAERLNTALENTNQAANAAGNAVLKVANEIEDRFASIRSTIQSSLESGFMSIVDGTMKAKDAFKAMASDIIKELFRVLVVQRMVGSFGGGGILGGIGRAFPALLPAAANGTSFAQGGMTLVGERGPELVNMPRGSQVIDARRTASRMGNGDIVQNFSFNLSANGDESVRRIVSRAAPQIVEAAKAGVADAVRRGGSFGRAFA